MSATVETSHMQASAKGTNSVTRKPINWWRIASYLILALFAVIYLGPLLMLVNTPPTGRPRHLWMKCVPLCACWDDESNRSTLCRSQWISRSPATNRDT
jgi:hypothetical protein